MTAINFDYYIIDVQLGDGKKAHPQYKSGKLKWNHCKFSRRNLI